MNKKINMSELVKNLTEESFQQTISTDKIVLIDVFTTWCGPCKILSPIINELAEHYQESVIISKVEADSNTDLADQLKVKSVPTLILFKGGQEIDRQMGAKSKKDLISWISQYQN